MLQNKESIEIIGSLESEIFELNQQLNIEKKKNNLNESDFEKADSFLENEINAINEANKSNSSIERFRQMEEFSELNSIILDLTEKLNESRKENIKLFKKIEKLENESIPIEEYQIIKEKNLEISKEYNLIKEKYEISQKEFNKLNELNIQLENQLNSFELEIKKKDGDESPFLIENERLRSLLRASENQLIYIQKENNSLKNEIILKDQEYINQITHLSNSFLEKPINNISKEEIELLKNHLDISNEKIINLKIDNINLKEFQNKLQNSLKNEINSHQDLLKNYFKLKDEYSKYSEEVESKLIYFETIIESLKKMLKCDSNDLILSTIQKLIYISYEFNRIKIELLNNQQLLTEETLKRKHLHEKLESLNKNNTYNKIILNLEKKNFNLNDLNENLKKELEYEKNRNKDLLIKLNDSKILNSPKSNKTEDSNSNLIDVLSLQNSELENELLNLRNENEELNLEINQLKEKLLENSNNNPPELNETIDIIIEQLEKSENQTKFSLSVIELLNSLKNTNNIDFIIESLDHVLISKDELFETQKILSNRINLNVDQIENQQKYLDNIFDNFNNLYSKINHLYIKLIENKKSKISLPQKKTINKVFTPRNSIQLSKPLSKI